jgi:hypothetical protein
MPSRFIGKFSEEERRARVARASECSRKGDQTTADPGASPEPALPLRVVSPFLRLCLPLLKSSISLSLRISVVHLRASECSRKGDQTTADPGASPEPALPLRVVSPFLRLFLPPLKSSISLSLRISVVHLDFAMAAIQGTPFGFFCLFVCFLSFRFVMGELGFDLENGSFRRRRARDAEELLDRALRGFDRRGYDARLQSL